MDTTDRKILEALQRNARISFAALAKQVHLSPPAVAERVKRLEESGVITGYHAEINPASAGLPLAAIIRMSIRSGESCSQLLTSLPEIPEVVSAYRVTGTDSAIVTAFASSTEHLEDLIDRLGKIGKPTTSIVTSQYRRIPAFSMSL